MEENKKELQTTTSSQYLKIYTPTSRELRKYTSTELCIKADVPSLGKMRRDLGEKKVEAYIKVWIINLQESLGLKRQMTPEQIDECAYYIVADFYNLNLADINLVFTDAKKGKYGELYESLNMAKILSWFSVYFEQRKEKAADINRREANGFKYVEKRNNGGKKFKDYLKND